MRHYSVIVLTYFWFYCEYKLQSTHKKTVHKHPMVNGQTVLKNDAKELVLNQLCLIPYL